LLTINLKNLQVIIPSLLGAAIATTMALILLFEPNFSTEDSSALVEGRRENGYEYVGYVVSDRQKVCAATLLNENTILSAAHCFKIEAGDNFNFGLGEFTVDEESLVPIRVIKYAAGYDPQTGNGPDIAIAKLAEDIKLESYPVIATPEENCQSSIVAYGAGVQGKRTTIDMFAKKSGEGCVKAITSTFLIDFNQEVGMCFGDSGGPIFKSRGSNELVGVLSGGIIEGDLDTIKCDPGNSGLAMNASSFQDLIADRELTQLSEAQFRILESERITDLSDTLNQPVSGEDFVPTTASPEDFSFDSSGLVLFAMSLSVIVLIFFITRIKDVL
jgi:secreted trypsin-like serine protease